MILLVVGIALGTGITAMVNAHGGDSSIVHACVNTADGSISIVAAPGGGDPNNDCSTLPGNWVPLDLDNDWSGAGTGSLSPSNLGDNVGIGTTTPESTLDVAGRITAEEGFGGGYRAGEFAALFQDFANNTILWNDPNGGGAVWLIPNPSEGLIIAQDLATLNAGTGAHWVGFDGSDGSLYFNERGLDADVRIFRPGTSTLAFSTGDVEHVRIDDAGNVGIGTTEPGKTLQVGQGFPADETDYGIGIFRHGTADDPGTYSFSNALLVEDVAGDGPEQLDDQGIVAIRAPRIADSDPNAHNATLLSVSNDNGSGLRVDGRRNVFVGHWESTNSVDVTSLFVEGNVGIGTANPDFTDWTGGGGLHIQRDAPVIRLENASTGAMDIGVDSGGGDFWLWDPVANETRIRIENTTGNVGIGNGFTPQSTLHVSGYTQLDLTAGAPPAADCDDASERGRMKVDSAAGLLYVCVDSGWVGK